MFTKIKLEEGVIPIGKERVEFYLGIVYTELFKKKELKLVSRGSFGVAKVLSILTDLLMNKMIEFQNNEVLIKFKPYINKRKEEIFLPEIEVNIKKI